MPRFFFDIDDGFKDTDAVGRELPDRHAARAHALQVAAAYAGRTPETDDDGGAIVVTVRDGAGDVLTTRLVFSVQAHDIAAVPA